MTDIHAELVAVRCTNCGQWKGADAFYVNTKTGHRHSWCRSCRAETEASRRRSVGIKKKEFSVLIDGKKKCMHCKEFKPPTEFSPSIRGIGKVSCYCRQCARQLAAKVRKARPNIGRLNTAKYRDKHRERYLAAHRLHQFKRREGIEISSDSSVTEDFLKSLYAKENCHYCGETVDPEFRTVDHKKPLSRGGSHTANNLTMACRGCNCSKRNKTEVEFLRWLLENFE